MGYIHLRHRIIIDENLPITFKNEKHYQEFMEEVFKRPFNSMILRVILQNENTSIRDLLGYVNLSYGAIYKRVKRLSNLGIIKIEKLNSKIDNKNQVSIKPEWRDFISREFFREHKISSAQKELLKLIDEKYSLFDLFSESNNPDHNDVPKDFINQLLELNSEGYIDISMKLTKFGKREINKK